MFFKKYNKVVNLINAHVIIEPTIINEEIRFLINLYEEISGIKLSHFSLNYKDPVVINKLKSLNIDASDFEVLTFYSAFDIICLNIGKRFLGDENTIVFEFVAYFPNDSLYNEKVILDFLGFLDDKFQLLYGYVRCVPKNYFHIGETPMKKSLFGGVSITVNKFGMDWLFDPKEILSSGVKGFYPYNFVNHDVLELPVIKKITAHPDVTIGSLNEKISYIKIPVEIFASLRKENLDIKEYIRE